MEYNALYPAGFHDLTLADLEIVFVNTFAVKERRFELIKRFKAFYELVSNLNINLEIWLDGSFCTLKPEPNDIDIAIFFDPRDLVNPSPEQLHIISVLQDNNLCKIRYKCDVYLIPNHNQANRSYWRGWFGFSRSESPKGIPRILHVRN